MNTKKNVLLGSLVGILLYIIMASVFSYDRCFAGGECFRLYDAINSFGPFILSLVPLFLLSLITYRMRDEVFRAWWNFARWFVPIIILATLFFETKGGGGGGWGISSGMDEFVVLWLLYIILVAVSLWRIWREYWRLKKKSS